MKDVISYKTPNEIAHAVMDLLVSAGRAVSARPYNLNNPDETDWWVVPSTEWPAYKHGKYHFDFSEDENTSKIFCGLNVEKGLGRKIESLCKTEKSKRHIMCDNWQWHKFVENMADGKVAEAIAKIFANTGQKVDFNLYLRHVDDPSNYDPYNPLNKPDYLRFITEGSGLELIEKETKSRETYHLKECKSIGELAEALIGLSNAEWFWIDIYVGLELTISDKQSEMPWREFEIYKNVLSPFEKWFV